ncbi:MAG TPA: PAS domain S-box protein, partial [Usitatibacter sp.]
MSAIPLDSQIDFDLVREAFDFTTVGLVVITPEGLFREVNRAFCEMTGYTRAELEGQSFRDFTHPDDVTRDDEQLRHVRSGGDLPMSTDKRFVRKDGSELWVRRSAAVVRDPAGNVRYVVGAMVDLTEQRQKDRAMRQLNGFLTALVDNSPVAIYTTDFEGVITFWNPAAERIFGFTREQMLGKYALFVQDEKRAEAAEIRRRIISGETLHDMELVRRRRDGTLLTLHGAGAPLRDDNDHITGLLFTCIDVTIARRSAAELERHLHFMRALIDAIPSPVYFKDNEGRFALRNRAWEDLFGGGKDWTGKTVRDMFDPDIA